MKRFSTFLSVAATLAVIAGPLAAETVVPVPRGKVAVLGLYLVNPNDPDSSDEQARINAATKQISDDLVARGFELVDTGPAAEKLKHIKNIAQCNGCDLTIARELGADYSVTGEVHKISNLILSFSLFLRDAKAKTNLRQGSVDIRGNTDESWSRGYRYLLKNLIFRGEGK